jgi:predicted RNA-binding Zn-ribbon protein involved in translation (DUF1610 family)
MAVVKLKYLKERPQLKRHLRYITHRRGREEGRLTRQLFNAQGLTDRRSVYSLIDTARRGTVLYKFMINLDPTREDTYKDVDLEHITRQTILALERQLGFSLPFAAVIHPADHTPLRHVHGIFLLQRRLSKEAFRALRQVAWTSATAQARLQRRARDRVLDNSYYRALPLARRSRGYQRHAQAVRQRAPAGGRRSFRTARGFQRGYKPPRLQRGCSSCGFGLTTGVSAFLPVCPACGRGLGRASRSLGLSR